eukprot:COSAG02_NODE_41494_length_394_cov_0.698305_1_plen_40_part_10
MHVSTGSAAPETRHNRSVASGIAQRASNGIEEEYVRSHPG